MLQNFGRNIKIAFVMLKLYMLAHISREAVLLIAIVAGLGISHLVAVPAESRSSVMYGLILYLTIGLSAAVICSICGKVYLYRRVHGDAVYLFNTVGQTLLGLVAGTRKLRDVDNWLLINTFPRDEQIERINFAASILRQVSEATNLEHALNWFVGANVGPEEISPAEAIRTDRFGEVRISAARTMEDQWS